MARAMTPPRIRRPPPRRRAAADVRGAPAEPADRVPACQLGPPPSLAGSAAPRATSPSRKKKPPALLGVGQQVAAASRPVRDRVSTETWSTVASTYAEAGDGGLDLGLEEVKGFLRLEGYEVDGGYAQQCFNQFDADDSGGISLDEFGVLMEHLAPDKLKDKLKPAMGNGGLQMQNPDDLKQMGDDEPWNQAKVDTRRRARGFYDKHRGHQNGVQLLRSCAVCGIATVLLAVGLFFCWWYNNEADPAAESCGQPSLIQCSDPNTHTISSDVEPAVDIVFVTDQSESMQPYYRDSVLANLQTFITGLSNFTTNWQLIVANAEDGCAARILTAQSYRFEETFLEMAAEWRGEVYPWAEALLIPAVRAVEQSGPGQCNSGFLRLEAMLHVVLVSDAATPFSGWLHRLQAVKKDPSLVKHDPNMRLPTAGLGPLFTAGAAASSGYGYRQLAASTGGLDANIMTADWSRACYEAVATATVGYRWLPLDGPAQQPILEYTESQICATALNGNGGNEGYLRQFSAEGGGFNLSLSYETHSQADQVIVKAIFSDNLTESTLYDTGCCGCRGVQIIDIPVGTDHILLQVNANCAGGSGTAWVVHVECFSPPPAPPPGPARTATCSAALDCSVATPGPGQICSRNLIREFLAEDMKVFGTFAVPELPLNHSDLVVRLDGRPLEQYTLEFVTDTVDDISIEVAVVSLSSPEVLRAEYRGGLAEVTLSWNQEKIGMCAVAGNSCGGGCVVTAYPACEEKDLFIFVLFFLLLLMLCCGVVGAIMWQRDRMQSELALDQMEEELEEVLEVAASEIFVRLYSGQQHNLQIRPEMTITEVKAMIESTAGIPADEQHLFHEELSTTQLPGPMTCAEARLVGSSVLTLMQTWTLLVQEMNSDAEVVAKAAELGLDVSANIYILEGVERHWSVDSVKLKVKALTGIPVEDQVLTHRGQLLGGRCKLTDFPAVHNRSTLVLVDSNSKRGQIKAAEQMATEELVNMKANSVLSMSAAGQIPGDSLSSLQENHELKMKIIFVVEPSGDRHAFEVLEHEWNIETVSARVEVATGIPPEQQVLKFDQKVLRPGKRLTSYGVQHGSELELFMAEPTQGARAAT